jgi:uncharacterized protein (TIGR02145 family)
VNKRIFIQTRNSKEKLNIRILVPESQLQHNLTMKRPFLSLIILVFFTSVACKKSDPNWRKYSIELTDLEVEQNSELSAVIHYKMKVSGNPRPEILEFGLIVTTNPEAPFHGFKIPSNQEDNLEDYTQNLFNLEGGNWWFVRPYAVTHRDTILGEKATFLTGKYYTEGNGVYDIEGNFYKTVIINGQEWMAENLRTRTFCNGDTLIVATGPETFQEYPLNTPITLSHFFNSADDSIFGKYYPGFMAFDERNICPCGWKVPHRNDVVAMANYVGNNQYLGGKMKSTGIYELGTGLWKYPNAMASNLTGLNMHPGGFYWRGQSYFSSDNTDGYFMILDFYMSWNNNLIETPGSMLLITNRRDLILEGIGADYWYTNIRCIKE